MSGRVRRGALPLLAVTAAALAAGCAGSEEVAQGRPASQEIVVFAAASLTEAFQRIGCEFEASSPGTTVTFSFGGSSGLAESIRGGAPADVFAAASTATMQSVVDAGGAAGPRVFARNVLTIAVPPGNPGRVGALRDLAREELRVALCAEQVPCGAAARSALAAAGVPARPDTLEQDVKAVLTKVSLGEADAGLVYRTDVRAAGDRIERIDDPDAERAVTDYPVAVLTDAPHREQAQRFVDALLGERGQAVLAEAGFLPP